MSKKGTVFGWGVRGMSRKGMVFGLGVVCAGAAAGATLVYENDFAVRRSAKPIPDAAWHAVKYVPGRLVNTGAFQRDAGRTQDGWYYGQNNNSATGLVINVSGNPMAAIYSPWHTQHLIMKHQLGNVFSNGWVELRADLAAPEEKNSSQYVQMRLTLGDDTFWSDNATLSGEYLKFAPFAVGLHVPQNTTTHKFWVRSGDVSDETIDGAVKGHWYRFRTRVNMAARRFHLEVFDMGTTQPTLETPTPADSAAVYTSRTAYPNGHTFYSDTATIKADVVQNMGFASATPVVNDLTTLGLCAYFPTGCLIADKPQNAARFDNVVVSHGASEATLTEYYVNDFATRKSRRAPAGVTERSYADAPSEPLSNTMTVLYTEGTSLLVAGASGLPNSYKYDPGVDGWRRINKDGHGTFSIQKLPGMTYTVARASGAGKFVIGATDLGTRLTSGTMKMQVDVRTPETWNTGPASTRALYATLGDERFYDQNKTQFDAAVGRAARLGVSGNINDASVCVPNYIHYPADAEKGATTNVTDVALSGNTWYRLLIKADLDHRTVDYHIYKQGANYATDVYNAATGTEVLKRTGMKFHKDDVNAITCAALWAYGMGDTEAQYIYFDNLKVWAKPAGAAAETLIYENLFHKRTVNSLDRRVVKVIGAFDDLNRSLDEFVRRNSGLGEVYVTKLNGDPVCECANDASDGGAFYSYATAPFGQSLRNGRLEVRADIRPPSVWQGATTMGGVYLGSEAFYQGNVSTQAGSESFNKYYANRLMFAKGSSATETVLTMLRPKAGGGTQVDYGAVTRAVTNSHWYRIVWTSDLTARTQDAAVYDMGTTKPASAAAGTEDKLVCTFTGVPFVTGDNVMDDGGVSCFSLATFGTNWSPFDNKYSVFFDNIRVTHVRNGLTITIR